LRSCGKKEILLKRTTPPPKGGHLSGKLTWIGIKREKSTPRLGSKKKRGALDASGGRLSGETCPTGLSGRREALSPETQKALPSGGPSQNEGERKPGTIRGGIGV